MAYNTRPELKTYLGIPSGHTAGDAKMDVCNDQAKSIIDQTLNRPYGFAFDVVTQERFVTTETCLQLLLAPAFDDTNTYIECDGEEVTDYIIHPDTSILEFTASLGATVSTPLLLSITYGGGYSPVPDDVKATALIVAGLLHNAGQKSWVEVMQNVYAQIDLMIGHRRIIPI